jgi:hypothetical protein
MKKINKQIDDLLSIINDNHHVCLVTLSDQVVATDFFINRGKDRNLRDHLEKISGEFSNLSLLTFYHAALIVAVRRNLNITDNLKRFNDLWKTQHRLLLSQLSLRWLVSACDTISDYGNESEKAIATAVSFGVNTIKLYETERFILKSEIYNTKKIGEFEVLFDGLTTFKVGKGNMIKNLLRRVDALDSDSYTTKIFKESVSRVIQGQTVYNRFSQLQEKNHWY